MVFYQSSLYLVYLGVLLYDGLGCIRIIAVNLNLIFNYIGTIIRTLLKFIS